MAVNLLVDLADARFGKEAAARAHRDAEARGYRLEHAVLADERLLAWIDLHFAPSWWSSEVRAGEVWYALAPDGDIAGFAAYDASSLRFPWLRAYADRTDIGIFGPFGVAQAHRGTGVGAALLTCALAGLRQKAYAYGLIAAATGDALIASYQKRTGAKIVDEFSYDTSRRYRTTILASGGGTNAQNVIDRVREGRLPLELAALIANSRDAFALQRARSAGIPEQAIVWDREAETRVQYDARLLDAVAATEPDLILLLGWMHLLPPAFIDRFPDILNVHPAFLPFDPHADSVVMPDGTSVPAFRGAHAIRDALAAHVAWSGASVHQVTAETDRGTIVVRTPFRLDGITDHETFVRGLREVEHGVVSSAIRRWVFERLER
ncbi:MAG: hypothetical protein NVSMB5_06290 [Candidatus Velthaea sp.]